MIKSRSLIRTLSYLGIIGFSLASLSAIGGIAYAHPEDEIRVGVHASTTNKEQVRPGINDARANLRDDIKSIRATTTEKIKDIRGDIKDIRSGSSTGTSTRGMIRDSRGEIKDLRTDARGEIKDKRKEARVDIARAYGNRMVKRLLAAIERIEKLGNRLDSRITKIKSAGENATTSEMYLQKSREELVAAKTNIEILKTVFVSLTASTTVGENIGKIHDATENVTVHIKASHQYLVEATKALKGLGAFLKNGTTTTATTTSN